MAIRRPFVNSTCATSSGLSHTQSRICSLVGANWVRFRSGRLVNGQRQSAGGFNFAHTSRHKRGTTHCVPTRKHQLVAFVVADDQRIERVVGGTAGYERLCLVEPRRERIQIMIRSYIL